MYIGNSVKQCGIPMQKYTDGQVNKNIANTNQLISGALLGEIILWILNHTC